MLSKPVKLNFNKLLVALGIFLYSTMGSLFVGIPCLSFLFAIKLCHRVWTYFSRRPANNTRLCLRGLSANSEPDESIESTMDALMENGFGDLGAARLISRLEWWNQMNGVVEMLAENEEAIDRVVNHIEVILSYHQLDQPQVEKDLIRMIFDEALRHPANSHVYAHLCQRLMESKIDWKLNFIDRLFQLFVDEFNRPLVKKYYDQLTRNKTNVVKLMAAVFRRRIPQVPEEWITDCVNFFVKRQADNPENSTEQLCLFLKTILISKSDEGCNLLPSQQNQLLPFFQSLHQTALNPKNQKFTTEKEGTESSDTSSESKTDTDSETESDMEPEIKTADEVYFGR